MNSECMGRREDIWLWMEGELETSLVEELQAHLLICTDCRQEVCRQKQLTQMLNALPLAHPAPGFADRFQERLSARRARTKTWLGVGLLALGGAAILALLVVSCASLTIDFWRLFPAESLLSLATKVSIVLGESAASLVRLALLVGRAWATAMSQPPFVLQAAVTAGLCALWAVVVTKRIGDWEFAALEAREGRF